MVVNTELYDILNVSPNSTTPEIKRCYKKLALQYHPDKNHNSKESNLMFQKVHLAYNILINPDKRSCYDKYGDIELAKEFDPADINDSFGGFSPNNTNNPADLFSNFFNKQQQQQGNAGFPNTDSNFPQSFSTSTMPQQVFSTSTTPPSNISTDMTTPYQNLMKGPNITHQLKCSLSDLYNGKTCKLALQRTKACPECEPMYRPCIHCQGHGTINGINKIGPLSQTWSQTCLSCNGTGVYIDPQRQFACKTCGGNAFVKERSIFKVKIQPGMYHGQSIKLPNSADEFIAVAQPNFINNSHSTMQRVQPGDVIIKIVEIEPESDKTSSRKPASPLFIRSLTKKHENLLLNNFPIDIVTSLCGGKIIIDNHPMGKLIQVTILPGELLRPTGYKCVEGLGMPIYEKGQDSLKQYKGNLYIKFIINFPDRLETRTIEQLKKLLQQDKFIQKQQEVAQHALETHLDDCVEMEEHVFNNFMEEPAENVSTQFKRRYEEDDESDSNFSKQDSEGEESEGEEEESEEDDGDDDGGDGSSANGPFKRHRRSRNKNRSRSRNKRRRYNPPFNGEAFFDQMQLPNQENCSLM
ncbi:j domain-containing protein Apj1p [Monosporozyma unispora]|nr:hypothetical protein C6P44_001060 [Kazachstania unispora]